MWMLVSVAHAACPDAGLEIDKAERAVVDARLEDADDALRQVEEALACGALQDPESLARFWLAEGALLALQASEDEATRAFTAAARTSPNTWTEPFGPAMRARWEAAAALVPGKGRIEIEGTIPEPYTAILDGALAKFPVVATDGLHVLQIGYAPPPGSGTASWGEIIQLPTDDLLIVSVPTLPAIESGQSSDAVTKTEGTGKGRRTALLVTGVALLGGGAVTGWLSTAQSDDIEGAATVPTLEDAYGTQRTFATLTYPLVGLGVTSVVLAFAW